MAVTANSAGAAYKATETAVYQEVVDRFLIPYWNVITGEGRDEKASPLPSAPEFERMAKELVESQNSEFGPTFKLPETIGGKAVKLKEIKTKIAALAASSGAGGAGIELGAIDEIPDKDKVHKIASAVERGVANGTSWWNVFKADSLGTIGDLVMGFFTGTLDQRMRERFARAAGTTVQQELSELRKEPGMATLLTSERVVSIGERVTDQARNTDLRSAQTEASPGVRVGNNIARLSNSELFKPVIEKSVRSEIDRAFNRKGADGNSAKERLMKGQTSGWTLWLASHGKLQEHEVDAVEKRVADTIVTFVTDKSRRFYGKKTGDLQDSEFKDGVIAEVTSAVGELHEERGWSYAQKRVEGIRQALESDLTPQMIAKLKQAASLAQGRGLLASLSSETREIVGRERQGRADRGISGPLDVTSVQAPVAAGPQVRKVTPGF